MDLGWFLNPVTGVLIRERRRRFDTNREEDHVKTEAEIEIMWPQAKESQEPPAAGRGKKGFSPRAFGGSMALPSP